jgi:hypothetical protein
MPAVVLPISEGEEDILELARPKRQACISMPGVEILANPSLFFSVSSFSVFGFNFRLLGFFSPNDACF